MAGLDIWPRAPLLLRNHTDTWPSGSAKILATCL